MPNVALEFVSLPSVSSYLLDVRIDCYKSYCNQDSVVLAS